MYILHGRTICLMVEVIVYIGFLNKKAFVDGGLLASFRHISLDVSFSNMGPGKLVYLRCSALYSVVTQSSAHYCIVFQIRIAVSFYVLQVQNVDDTVKDLLLQIEGGKVHNKCSEFSIIDILQDLIQCLFFPIRIYARVLVQL